MITNEGRGSVSETCVWSNMLISPDYSKNNDNEVYWSANIATISGCESKFKVTWSKIMVRSERSCHKEYTCEINKPDHLRFINYDQG